MDELEVYFENETRAVEWRNLRLALTDRLKALKAALSEATRPEERATLERQITAVDKQIDVLRIEEAAQQFVEDSVRVTVNAHVLREMGDADEDYS